MSNQKTSEKMNENVLNETCDFLNKSETFLQQKVKGNINDFIEYTFKDEKGQWVTQAAIHEEIQWHVDECKRQGIKNCGILAPWGHGKTEQVLARILDELGKNCNVRSQIICNTDDNAKARVVSIKKYIEEDEDYHKVYPDIVPGKDEWGKHKIVVERDSKSKDGSIEAWGITTSGTGSRADLQIFDDPVDLRNAILNPAMREQVKYSFYNVWMSRLVSNGFRIYIATVWHEDDLTHELLRNDEWNFLVMKVSEDFKSIECDSCFKGKYQIPLWELWNEKALKSQIKQIGERAFNRGYRQDAMSDEYRTFPSSDSIFDWNNDRSVIRPDWGRVTGIDPFGQQVVIFTIAVNFLNGRRFVYSIKRGKWSSGRTINELLDTYRNELPQIIVVENNAAQAAIIEWAKEKDCSLPIVPFTTGAQKAKPEIGLPGMEVEFANGAWCCPMKGIDPMDTDHPYNVWRRELRSHPVAEAADTVMASWFAREGARLMMQAQQQSSDPNDDIVTAEEMGVEPVTIGDY